MIKKIAMLLFTITLLFGCGSDKVENKEEQPSNTGEISLEMLDITFSITPEVTKKGETATFSSIIFKKGTAVDNAKVEFEVWLDGNDQHETIPAVHAGQGKYTAEKTFEADGSYKVIVHVTTPELHQMIEKTFDVGSMEEKQTIEPATDTTDSHHNHHDGMMIHLMSDPGSITSGEEVKLTAHIMKDNHTLKEAKVQFEIWKDGQEKHFFIDAMENSDGTYDSNYTFSESGSFHINVHVEKGDIHAHLENKVTIK